MDPDDLAYRKSVRNMALVIAAMVATVLAAIFVPAYVNPPHNIFLPSASYDSPVGFTMHVEINSTRLSPGGWVLITGWVNSTSGSPENVTAANRWAFRQDLFWSNLCASGWPIGLGVMRGHYTQDNYTLGTPLSLARPPVGCPTSAPPQFFLFYPHSSRAIASINGNPTSWVIQTTLAFSWRSLSPTPVPGRPGLSGLPRGVYTAILADEWGDVLTINFLVA